MQLPVHLVLDNIRSLYNVGSIFRTADGMAVEHVLLAGYTPRPPRKEIEKTALGATKTVPWSHTSDPEKTLLELKKKGYNICCLEQTDRSIPFTTVKPQQFPLCLIVGNEVSGVSPRLLSLCDLALEIPMFGSKHSFNVAVACGIALFQLSLIYRTSRIRT